MAALPALRALNAAQVDFILFKSLQQVEDLYGHAGGRRTTDVDIIISGPDTHEVLAILQRAGWRVKNSPLMLALLQSWYGDYAGPQRRTWTLERENGLRGTVDVHPDSSHDHPPIEPSVWAKARRAEVDGVDCYLLADEDRLVFLTWHVFRHGFDESRMRDIQIILRDEETLDWQYMADRSRRTGTSGMLRLACELAMEENQSLHAHTPVMTLRYGLHQRLLARYIKSKRLGFRNIHTDMSARLMLDLGSGMLRALAEFIFPTTCEFHISEREVGEPVLRQYLRAVVHINLEHLRKIIPTVWTNLRPSVRVALKNSLD